jgi:hypothetical protein
MRQCQDLDRMDWNILFSDEIIQHKIMKLEYLTLHFNVRIDDRETDESKLSNITKVMNSFKNHSQKLSVLKFDHQHEDFGFDNKEDLKTIGLITKGINSLVGSQQGLKGFICKYGCVFYFGITTFVLESQVNSLTNLILGDADFRKLSFDSLENCMNLESLRLKFSRGLELGNINHYTTFKNLKQLELSLNKWSSEVTALIIKKAGSNLISLTIGERKINDTINDDTLATLTACCPKINSLSISQISEKSFNMLFSHIKDLKLITLKIHQVEHKIVKSKDLLEYIEHQNTLSGLGIGKSDDYWNNYTSRRDRFKDFMTNHNIKLFVYQPFSRKEESKIKIST